MYRRILDLIEAGIQFRDSLQMMGIAGPVKVQLSAADGFKFLMALTFNADVLEDLLKEQIDPASVAGKDVNEVNIAGLEIRWPPPTAKPPDAKPAR